MPKEAYSSEILGYNMRSSIDWLQYLRTLTNQGSNQSRDLAQQAHSDVNSVYATQWAHDVRCMRSGIEHRRVGGAVTSLGRDEWLQAGVVTRQALAHK